MNEIVLRFCNATDLVEAYTRALGKLSATWTHGYIFPNARYMIIDPETYHISYFRIYFGEEPIIEVK